MAGEDDERKAKAAAKPHAVLVPVPAQGHITPMMKVAKLLHHRGFQVTFVNTEYNHRRFLRSQGQQALDSLSSSTFRFAAIPDGISCQDEDATQDLHSAVYAMMYNLLAPFRQLVFELNDTDTSHVPPVTCIVSDGSMSFALDVAEELGIPIALLWTHSACGTMAYASFRRLSDMGLVPLKDSSYLTNGYLDTAIDWIPGMKGIKLKDLPTTIRTTDPDDIIVKLNIHAVERSRRGSAVIVNTFEDLEPEILTELKSMFPNISAVGPLHLLENQLPADEINLFASNLWKDDSSGDYLEWLDSKEPDSVLYVNFGTIARVTLEQLVEFAWGLANSKQSFFWIIRADLVAGDAPILPPEFAAEIKDRGLLASWCNQEKVLNHPAVGGFLTHCGWNSILDSLCAGVPLICWPALAEQTTNSWFCCNQWGIGLELDSDVKRGEVETLARELMTGEGGKQMKLKAIELKHKAEEACSSTGSSYVNFEKMVNEVLLSKFKWNL